MLVITRRPGEYVLIGDDIKVHLLEKGNQVRLGIEAPRDVPILRNELLERDLDREDFKKLNLD